MKKSPSPLKIVAWTLYLVGTALVFGSYLNVVPLGLAWVGWGAGMAGWLAMGAARRGRRDRALWAGVRAGFWKVFAFRPNEAGRRSPIDTARKRARAGGKPSATGASMETSMKAKLSMAFSDLRGKDGSVVIQKGKSGLKLTPRNKARNPKSTAQTGVRSALSKSSKLFAAMTPAQAAAWNAYGATQTKKNAISGTSYTSSGINAFNALASKFLQASPTSVVPMTPPTTAFAGDGLSIAVTTTTGSVTWTASAANSVGVKTELLLQPLKGKNRQPSAKGYRTKAFATFATGALTYSVSVPAGYYAAAYRYVNVATGQETALVPLSTLTVALSLEDGGQAEDAGFERMAA